MRTLILLASFAVFACSQESSAPKTEPSAAPPIHAKPVSMVANDSEAVPAIVCGFGQTACGQRCYDASKGEKCCPNGKSVCGFGQTCCGERCFDAAKGEKCCPNGTSVCGFGQSCCGDRCYAPSRGEKCIQ